MFSWVGKLSLSKLTPWKKKDDKLDDDRDPLILYRDLERHAFGEFSYAVVQANDVLEDHGQVEVGQNATFVGVYDGHGGPDASRYVCEKLFTHLDSDFRAKRVVTLENLATAVTATEEEFILLVDKNFADKPLMATVGSCCLVGIISEGTLNVANMGDSRAVIGRLEKPNSNKIVAEQITLDHKASEPEVRNQLRSDHPDDPQIVMLIQSVWHVRGKIQISRSIGDAYLKSPKFALDSSFKQFHLPEPIKRPVLGNRPALYTRELTPVDRFVVFASDGLWEHMTNNEVVKMVDKYPRHGIARRLIRCAMNEAGKKSKKKVDEVRRMGKENKRTVPDDITVVVIFLDRQVIAKIAEVSMREIANSTTLLSFNTLGEERWYPNCNVQ